MSVAAEYDRVIASSHASSFSLVSVREIIWSHLREVCPSLRPMNCDAVFGLNDTQKSYLLSFRNMASTCRNCLRHTEFTSEVIIFFLTHDFFTVVIYF